MGHWSGHSGRLNAVTGHVSDNSLRQWARHRGQRPAHSVACRESRGCSVMAGDHLGWCTVVSPCSLLRGICDRSYESMLQMLRVLATTGPKPQRHRLGTTRAKLIGLCGGVYPSQNQLHISFRLGTQHQDGRGLGQPMRVRCSRVRVAVKCPGEPPIQLSQVGWSKRVEPGEAGLEMAPRL